MSAARAPGAAAIDPGKEWPCQEWRTDTYVGNAGFVADLGAPVVELLAPRAGELILDLGCGDGRLTERIAATGARVIGADAAPDLLRAARGRDLAVVMADGHALPFSAKFDAVFSNAALHWMTRHEKVIAGVRAALKPGGRFVGEMGGFGNVAAILTALLAVLERRGVDARAHIPWFFPSAEQYHGLLERGGFAVRDIALIPRPTPLPTGMRGWLATFCDPLVGALAPEARTAAVDDAIRLLEPSLCDSAGNWIADYVRLRFAADAV
jgi:SAM-dependent methyltransferase